MINMGDERPAFIPGIQDEWRAFAERHQGFLAAQRELFEVANAVFRKMLPTPEAQEAEHTIYLLVRQAAQDFQEIFLLCANGYGLAAEKILRGMFERLVTAIWLVEHPKDTQRFLEWELIQRAKVARAAIEAFGDELGAEWRARMQAEIDQAEPYRAQFTTKCCNNCDEERPASTWATVDFVSMVRKTKSKALMRLLVPAYHEPLMHAHATAKSLASFMNGWCQGRVIHREEADQALRIAHCLLLLGLETLARKRDGQDDERLATAWKSYETVWPLGE